MFLFEENFSLTEALVWQFAGLLSWIVIIFSNFLCHWLLPTATLVVGEGAISEEDLRTYRWIAGLVLAAIFSIVISSIKVSLQIIITI